MLRAKRQFEVHIRSSELEQTSFAFRTGPSQFERGSVSQHLLSGLISMTGWLGAQGDFQGSATGVALLQLLAA